MALKPLKIVTNEAPAAKKSDIRIIDIDGAGVSAYNEAVVALKNAEAVVGTIGAQLKNVGSEKLYGIAVANPDTPPSSIKLRDEKGAVVRYTSQNKYAAFDPEVADSVFKELGAELEHYAQFIAKVTFDSKIFLAQAGTSAGDEGKFSIKIYNAYKQSIDRATAQLIRDGLLAAETASPLNSVQVANVLPDFNEKRWKAFPTVEAQQKLSSVISNTTMLVPVVEGDESAKSLSKRK